MVGVELDLVALDITFFAEVVEHVELCVDLGELRALLAPEVVVGGLPVAVASGAHPAPAVGFVVDVDPGYHRVLDVGVSALIPNPWPW